MSLLLIDIFVRVALRQPLRRLQILGVEANIDRKTCGEGGGTLERVARRGLLQYCELNLFA